ncbi:MAG: N-acetylglucosamine kinase [Blastocatellia bacterium]
MSILTEENVISGPVDNPSAGDNQPRGYFLGVDGGGTSTRAVILDSSAATCGQGHAEAANYHRVGLASAIRAINAATAEACQKAGVRPDQINSACIGLAGVGHPDHHQTMLTGLRAAFPIQEIQLETDARVALAGATGNRPGVVIIAGTGSIACGINARGQFERAGGWGPVMGDEGSGTYIGKRALEKVMEAYDGRGGRTKLTAAILRHYDVSSAAELPAIIYKDETSSLREAARLSRVVVDAAEDGSLTARQILARAAAELARGAIAVIEKLGMQNENFRVATVGGVFESGEWVAQPLRKAIAAIAPLAVVSSPLYPPVIGAAQMAMAAYQQKA